MFTRSFQVPNRMLNSALKLLLYCYNILPPYHSITVSFYHFTILPLSIAPLYKCPLYHSTTLPPCHFTNLPLYHSNTTNLQLYYSTTLSIYQSTDLPIYHSTDLSLYQCTNQPLNHSTTLLLILFYLYQQSVSNKKKCPSVCRNARARGGGRLFTVHQTLPSNLKR
jgi:hypothetical protein